MANNAIYRMKIVGAQDNVQEFIRAMQWKDEYTDCGAGRVCDCEVFSEGTVSGTSLYSCECEGACAWSIISAMRNGANPNNIERLSERLKLAIEAYASECGFEFQEHFCVINGEIQCDECIDWTEVDVDALEDVEDGFWEKDWVVESGITKENATQYAEDGYVSIGGYTEWNFELI